MHDEAPLEGVNMQWHDLLDTAIQVVEFAAEKFRYNA